MKALHIRSYLNVATSTQTGQRGGVNQDSIRVNSSVYFAVADGVGGGSHGELASQVALKVCENTVPDSEFEAQELIKEADDKVRNMLSQIGPEPGATTIAIVWLKGFNLTCAHVGDSRIYHFRSSVQWKGKLPKLWHKLWSSKDHTYEHDRMLPPHDVSIKDPSRMIGLGAKPMASIRFGRLQADEMIMICSDGLHGYVADNDILDIINIHSRLKQPFSQLPNILASRAVAAGSKDDISIVMLKRCVPRWRAPTLLSVLILLLLGWKSGLLSIPVL